MDSESAQKELVKHLPNLRAFAMSLCRNRAFADDLVQDTLMKAWMHIHTFQEGTNMRAWLFTILRNNFVSIMRRDTIDNISIDVVDDWNPALGRPPEQDDWMGHQDLQKALSRLQPSMREAIMLIGAEGFSYEETAEICGCAVGTIKSRVHRARARLLELLEGGELTVEMIGRAHHGKNANHV